MTKSERRGLRKIKARLKSREIAVVETDKSGSLCVMPLAMYWELGKEHVEGDATIDWERVREIQGIMKGHLRALNLIFNPGSETTCPDRVREAKELRATIIPIVSLLIKDHKEPDEQGRPKSRPVCGASSSINGELSEWISDILESISQSMETDEVVSSEELLSFVDDLNKTLEAEGVPELGLCVGSLDVKALYPSLVVKACAKLVHDRVMKSPVKFPDISAKWASIYVAMNLEVHEVIRTGLQHLVPSRTANKNKGPTVKTIEVDQKGVRERWSWFKDPEKYTESEKKCLMAKVVECMVNT